MFRRIISTSSSWVPVPLRLALAAVFIGHGCQKVLGRFAGPGLAKFTSYPAPFPFHAPGLVVDGRRGVCRVDRRRAATAGITDTSRRLPDFLHHADCNHWRSLKGGFFAPGGYEYPMTLLAVSLALLISGGGAASIDLAISGRRRR